MTHEDALNLIAAIDHLSKVVDDNAFIFFVLGLFFLLFKNMSGK